MAIFLYGSQICMGSILFFAQVLYEHIFAVFVLKWYNNNIEEGT